MAFFWQVFFSDRKVSRHRRPSSLRVLPLILRMVTGSRTSCSELLVLSGTSGRSRATSSSAFAPLEAGKRRIELGKAGGAAEQAVEPGLQTGLGPGRRIGAIELEVAVEPPDQMAHQGDGGTLRLGHRHQAVDQTLGVDPAQAVAEHVELTGPIADDDGVLEQAMVVEAAGDRGLAGQSYRLGAGDPERDQMVGPGVLVGKLPAVVSHQPLDQECRSVLLMQVDQGGGIDHVVLEPAAQGHQEHQPALGCDGVEAGEAVVADLGGHAVDAQVPGAGIVNTDPARGFQPGLLDRRFLGMERVMVLGQQIGDLPGRDQDAEIVLEAPV